MSSDPKMDVSVNGIVPRVIITITVFIIVNIVVVAVMIVCASQLRGASS